MNLLTIARTMGRRGMLTLGPPLAQVGQLLALGTWGFGLAGEFRQATARSPRAVAVVDEERGSFTYAEVLARSDKVAHALAARGIAPRQRVGLLARNHVGAVEIMVGASALGVDLVLGNTGLSAAQFAVIAQEQELALVIHDDEFARIVAELPAGLPVVRESDFAAELSAMPAPPRLKPPERPGRTIVLTSGTTGAPKGAARKTPGGVGPLISIIDRIPLRARDTILISAPVFHTWGFAALQLAIALRATVVLQRRFTPQGAVALLQEHRPDALFAIPVMLQRMVASGTDPGAEVRGRLRVVATSGSGYPPGFSAQFMDHYGDVLYNLYGSTEASWVCIATPADMRRDPDTAGTPPLGTVVKILDEDGAEVPEGEIGRIFCGNELVFEGYTNGSTKEFVDGMVATGDLGHVADGLYFVDGRDDDMIVSGGENVYPIEVETLLTHLPGVREAAVCEVPDPEFGQRLAAFIELDAGAGLTADEVREHVRTHLARHCIPRDVVFVAQLPRNATGKILRRDLVGLVDDS